MTLETLVSTMYQNDYSLLEKMNIQSDAIIVNQCNVNEFAEFSYKGYRVKFMSFAERGIGLSRNNALLRASSDISLFADDDVVYIDGYKDIIIKAFEENRQADVIVFNVPSTNPERPTYIIPKHSRVRWYNCQRYGAVKIAIRTEQLKHARICFSLLFGGGAKYSCGEDSLFIIDCINKGLNVYANPTIIGYVNQESSSWFAGYNEKYFFDQGLLFACVSKRWAKILCLQFLVRHYKMFRKDISIKKSFKHMIEGVKTFTRQKQ
ncbi:MAG: glycosyltransferase family 2 protein [Clostridiales bacterium]|jgi:glycosyltransferase involved in cell wall biosynthesis|nr:glycosyltransferase family 2 protein [Clostridiales bacterium]